MRYLITGGAGFIGSHLPDALLADGHHVHALDNLSTGTLRNIAHLKDHDRFSLTVGNVLDYHTMEQTVQTCDRIVHLAAVGVKRVLEEPVETIRTNIGGTENVLQLAHYHDTPAVIASTSEVYGNNDKVPFAEDDPVREPISPYAATKRSGELLAHTFHHLYDITVHCLRFFTVYGPRQRPERSEEVLSECDRTWRSTP